MRSKQLLKSTHQSIRAKHDSVNILDFFREKKKKKVSLQEISTSSIFSLLFDFTAETGQS